MPSKFQNLIDKLDGSETFTKRIKNEKTFNHVKDNVPLIADANMMCDILFLPETPTKKKDDKGFKYLFVIVDLADDSFDIEPMKELNSEAALKAMKACFKRKYVKEPEYSLKTDEGAEFKGVFNKFLYDHNILHKGVVAGRHQSMSNVESLNRQLSRLFNLYMNKQEVKTGEKYTDWVKVVDIVRVDLNKLRLKKLPDDINSHEYPLAKDYTTDEIETVTIDKKGKKTIKTEKVNKPIKAKFKVGDYVYRYLDHPRNALGKRQNTEAKREGDILWDTTPRQITQVFTMGGDGPLYRYYLEGVRDASYTTRQLRKAPAPN